MIALGGFLIFKKMTNKPKEEENPVTNISKKTNEIEGYGYTLDDRDGQLFTDLFKKLKHLLEENKESETFLEEYQELLAKLFIVDLYTISNKISKYDIGGVEYLYEPAKSSFQAKVLDTIYKTVEDDSYKTRNQKLPTVETIEMTKKEDATYYIGNEEYVAHEVTLAWTYKEDLGYDKVGKITMIEQEEKLWIVSYEAIS